MRGSLIAGLERIGHSSWAAMRDSETRSSYTKPWLTIAREKHTQRKSQKNNGGFLIGSRRQ
jgi:hypothetical protein|nr:MAG: hypothetical protein DIU57_00600 [Pseudomonadota bacterium]